MHTNLPKADDIKIASLQEANEIIKLLILKIEEMEERECVISIPTNELAAPNRRHDHQ